MRTVRLRTFGRSHSDRAGRSSMEFNRSGALTGRILTEGDIKEPGGRWDPNVSIIAESLQKNFTPMLPALRELKDALVSAAQCVWRPRT